MKATGEADAELAELLADKPFMVNIVFDVMNTHRAVTPLT